MSPVQIHLMLTHAPLFGTIVRVLLLGVAIWRNSDEFKKAAFGLLVGPIVCGLFLTIWQIYRESFLNSATSEK